MCRRSEVGCAVLHELRDPELLAALERLQVQTRGKLAGQLVGAHRSRRYGSSLDFADFREYQPGDDFRRIDYVALARLDQLLVRLYDAEDDLTLRLVIDASASMALDGKFGRACEMAGALGFVALNRRDRVEVSVAGHPPARFSGRNAIGALFDHLESLVPGGAGSLSSLAGDVVARQRGAGMTVVCSDFLEADWDAAIGRFPTRGAELFVVHVLGGGELEPPELGDVDLVDSETGDRVPLTMSDNPIRSYLQRLEAWMDDVRSATRRAGGSYLLVDSRTPLRTVLLDNVTRSEAIAI